MRLLHEIELDAQVLTDQIFLHLAADRERKALHEAHVAGHLVMRNSAAAELPNFFLSGHHAVAQPDAGANGLAIPRVRHADHGDVEYRWMTIQEFLNFPRRNVLAAADDHVLHATNNVAVTLLVDEGQIAGVHPATFVDRFARALGIPP